VRTALISDLHLGMRDGGDVLRHERPRQALAEALAGTDRLVLLGDTVELREARLGEAVDAARPLFRELGGAMAGREVVVVPGNHDHQLDPWVPRRRFEHDADPLGLEQLRDPTPGGPLAELAAEADGAAVRLAYPGLWVRPGVYATHGHWLDLHQTAPILECIGIAAVARAAGGLPDGPLIPDAYEAVTAPLYALLFSLAQDGRRGGSRASAALWRRLTGRSRLRRVLVSATLLPGAIFALNRAGLGHFKADLSGGELEAASLRAFGELVARLDIDAEQLIFGHSHRPGPLAYDGPWQAPGGARLVNCGSWALATGLHGRPRPGTPYWPGTIVFVDDDGPARVERVELSERDLA